MSVSVSVIVPCYNVAPYLEECLESLVNQSLRDLEIICVNDGSTDATPELLEAWARKDGRIHVIHGENGGPSSARNAGMDAAGGEFIGFVDPDDYVEHAMYGRLLEEARKYDADVVACGYTGFSNRDGTVLEKESCSPAAGMEEDVKSSLFRHDSVWMRMGVVVWNKLYRKDFLDRHGLRFEPDFRLSEDDAFRMLLLAHAGRVAVIPDRMYWYRRELKGSLSFSMEDGRPPFMIVLERLMYATAYWKKVGWLDSGLKNGWVQQALRRYVLGYLLSLDHPLPQLNAREWALSGDKCREWFFMTGGTAAFRDLGKWDVAVCRLLAASRERPGALSRAWWKLLSRRCGRRGRYYAVRLHLSSFGQEEETG